MIAGLFTFIKEFAPIIIFAASVIVLPIVILVVVVLDSYVFVLIEPPDAVDIVPLDIVPLPDVEISPDVVIFPEPVIFPDTVIESPTGNCMPPSAIINPDAVRVVVLTPPLATRLPLFILTVPYKLTADASDPIVIGFATVEPVPILIAPIMLLAPVPIFNIPSVCNGTMLKEEISEVELMVDELMVDEFNVEKVSLPWAVGYVKKLLFAVAKVK